MKTPTKSNKIVLNKNNTLKPLRGNIIIQEIEKSDKLIEEVVKKYIGGLAKDYGYCNCKRKHKDIHMDIYNDLEKIKPLLIKELKRRLK